MTFSLIDQFYRIAGPNNMKLVFSDSDIVIEMKPVLLPFYKTEHRDEFELLKSSLVEGKLICRPNGVVLHQPFRGEEEKNGFKTFRQSF